DAPASSRITSLVDGLAPNLPQTAAGNDDIAPVLVPLQPVFDDSTPRFEAAPPHYWRRWASDAEPAHPLGPAATESASDPDGERPTLGIADAAPSTAEAKAEQPIRAASMPKAAPAPVAAVARAHHHRIYHLSDANEVSLALDQRLEHLGYE